MRACLHSMKCKAPLKLSLIHIWLVYPISDTSGDFRRLYGCNFAENRPETIHENGRKRNMPRMSKKRKHELSFYLNDRGRGTYNELCRKCQHAVSYTHLIPLHGGAESQLEPAASVNLHRFRPHLLNIGSGSSFVLQNVNLSLLRVHHDRDKAAVAGDVYKRQCRP